MKDITELLKENLLNESANNFMKSCFGKRIIIGPRVKEKFQKLGLDFRHEEDVFVLYADGRLEYRNPRLFSGSYEAKVYKAYLNRIIKPSDEKVLKITDRAEEGKGLDIKNPYRYLRAVLNAFPQEFVEIAQDGEQLVLKDLDYTSGDLSKDNE